MGDIDIDIDIKRADAVLPAMNSGLRMGLEDSGDWMMDEGEDRARDAVMGAGRVWRETLKEAFDTEENQWNRYYHWKGEIRNEAPHAGINERGLKPGANPSVQDIIPWVSSKMVPNAEAQEKAALADPENWDAELKGLASTYSPAMVITAFAVKNELETGYSGIGFMETTEQYLQSYAHLLVKNKVEKQMNRALRAAGVQ